MDSCENCICINCKEECRGCTQKSSETCHIIMCGKYNGPPTIISIGPDIIFKGKKEE